MTPLLTSELEHYLNKIHELTQKPFNLSYRWRKNGPNTSQILDHTLQAVNYWVKELLLHIPSYRDRDDEFNKDHSMEEIQSALNKSLACCFQLASKKIYLHQPIEISADHIPGNTTEWTVLTVLLQITAHTAEHVGQLKCL